MKEQEKAKIERIISEVTDVSEKLSSLWEEGVLVIDRDGRVFVSPEVMKELIKYKFKSIEFTKDGYKSKPYTVTIPAQGSRCSFIAMCSQEDFKEIKELVCYMEIKEKIRRFLTTLNELKMLKDELAEYIADWVSFFTSLSVNKTKSSDLEIWFDGGDGDSDGYIIEHAIIEAFPEMKSLIKSVNYIESFPIYEAIRMKLANIYISLKDQE
jgi:hypothetical protein